MTDDQRLSGLATPQGDVRLLALKCQSCGADLDTAKAHGDILKCIYCNTEYKVIDNRLERLAPTLTIDYPRPAVQKEPKSSVGGFGALSAIMAVIVAVVALIVGVFVIAQLQASLPTDIGGSSTNTSTASSMTPFTNLNHGAVANTTANAIQNVFSSVYNAYNLLVVILIVMAAVGILATIFKGFGGH